MVVISHTSKESVEEKKTMVVISDSCWWSHSWLVISHSWWCSHSVYTLFLSSFLNITFWRKIKISSCSFHNKTYNFPLLTVQHQISSSSIKVFFNDFLISIPSTFTKLYHRCFCMIRESCIVRLEVSFFLFAQTFEHIIRHTKLGELWHIFKIISYPFVWTIHNCTNHGSFNQITSLFTTRST
jgi:hypothetical protein